MMVHTQDRAQQIQDLLDKEASREALVAMSPQRYVEFVTYIDEELYRVRKIKEALEKVEVGG